LQIIDAPAVRAPSDIAIEPSGELSIRTLAMPADTNQNGDIFDGWLLSQMDLVGGIFASIAGAPAKHLRRGIEVIVAMPKAAGDDDDPRIEPSPSPSP
jgi:hypothetical protein